MDEWELVGNIVTIKHCRQDYLVESIKIIKFEILIRIWKKKRSKDILVEHL